jgi:hypothetical protein
MRSFALTYIARLLHWHHSGESSKKVRASRLARAKRVREGVMPMGTDTDDPCPRSSTAIHYRAIFARALIATVALFAVLSFVAIARPADADNGSSVSDVSCGILLPGILPEGQVISTIGTLVISSSGTATLTCLGQLDPALAPAQAVIITDIPCALGEGGQVGESHTQVSPNGNVLLVCHNNPGSEPFPTPGPDD